MKNYAISIKKDTNLDSVLARLRGLELPCSIHIYDRVFIVANKDELQAFVFGLEVGNYIALDKIEDIRDIKLDPQAG